MKKAERDREVERLASRYYELLECEFGKIYAYRTGDLLSWHQIHEEDRQAHRAAARRLLRLYRPIK